MKKSHLLGVLCASILFAFSTISNAIVISETESLGGSGTIEEVAFSGFNSSLGTLTAVDLTYDIDTFVEGECL